MRLPVLFALQLVAVAAAASVAEAAATLSSRMVHRLSDEARLEAGPRAGWWPQRGSGEYYRALVRSDLQRQKRRLAGKYQLLSLSKGGSTFSPGNDLGWCASFPAPVGSYVPLPQLLTVFYFTVNVIVFNILNSYYETATKKNRCYYDYIYYGLNFFYPYGLHCHFGRNSHSCVLLSELDS